MDTDRIEQLADLASAKIRSLIIEARDSITEAITAAVEEAQENDGKAVLRLSPRIAWDVDGTAVTVTLRVVLPRTYEASGNLDDPNQPGLALVDGDGDAMPERTGKAVAKIAKAIRDAGGTGTAREGGAQ